MSSRKRIAVPLTEKKRYAEMIIKGASRSTISDLYRKKYKTELPERTFFDGKRKQNRWLKLNRITDAFNHGRRALRWRSLKRRSKKSMENDKSS